MSTVDGTLDSKPSGYEERDDPAVVTRLLLASGLMLFVELALIRWLGSSVVHLSYFSNFVLLGSFLGIGAGFLISRKEWSIWPISLPLLAILVIGVIQSRSNGRARTSSISPRSKSKDHPPGSRCPWSSGWSR